MILEKEGEKEKSELQLLKKKTQSDSNSDITGYNNLLQPYKHLKGMGQTEEEVREIGTVLLIKTSTTKEKCDVNLSSSPCPKWDF